MTTILTLPLSIPTYNEIAGLLEQKGIKINDRGTIELKRTDLLTPPVDYRSATIRRDVLTAICNSEINGNLLKICEQAYQWVLTGELPDATKQLKKEIEGW